MEDQQNSRNGYYSDVTDCVRDHPAGAILAASIGGLIVGLHVPLLQGHSHRETFMEGLQRRVHDITAPTTHRVNRLVSDGAHSIKDGIDHLHMDRGVKCLRHRMASLFH